MRTSDLRLLLTPEQRLALRERALRLGVREQTIARDAVLAVLAEPEPVDVAPPKDDALDFLHILDQRKPAIAQTLRRLIRQVAKEQTTDAWIANDLAITAARQAAGNAQDAVDSLKPTPRGAGRDRHRGGPDSPRDPKTHAINAKKPAESA